jgi:hypothetical protein
MATGTTGVSALGDSAFAALLQSEIIKELRPAMTTREVLRQAPKGPSRVAQWTLYADLGPADSLVGGDDLTDVTTDAITDSSTSVTAAETGFRVDVSDLARDTVVQDIYSDMGAYVARSIGEQFEDTLAKLMDDFSNVTTAGSTLTPVDLLAAVSGLEQRDVPGPYVGYLDPKQTGELRIEIATTGASYEVGSGNSTLVRPFGVSGFFGTYMGLPIWQTSLVVTTSNLVGGAVLTTGASDRPALGLYEVRAPRIETQRDVTERTLQIVGTQAFGMVEIIDGSGQTVKSAA